MQTTNWPHFSNANLIGFPLRHGHQNKPSKTERNRIHTGSMYIHLLAQCYVCAKWCTKIKSKIIIVRREEKVVHTSKHSTCVCVCMILFCAKVFKLLNFYFLNSAWNEME